VCLARPPTDIYTLSLHDALPICRDAAAVTRGGSGPGRSQARPTRDRVHVEVHAHPQGLFVQRGRIVGIRADVFPAVAEVRLVRRSEEHTSELQSRENLVCRLLLE